MKYIELINEQLKKTISSSTFPIAIYGQNVAAGSYLGGLTRGLNPPAGRIINTPNCELTLCGVGMGLMAAGVDSIFFMKQLDFLLLGMDQLTHTWNVLKTRKALASFTIFTVITDNGLEGKQSCFDRFYELCRTANVQGYVLDSKFQIEHQIEHSLIYRGVKIMAVSQTLLQKEVV